MDDYHTIHSQNSLNIFDLAAYVNLLPYLIVFVWHSKNFITFWPLKKKLNKLSKETRRHRKSFTAIRKSE